MAKGQKKQKQTPETISKLEQAFSIGATIAEACLYAEITPVTYHQWVKESVELLNKFNRLRGQPILKAKKTIVDGLSDPLNAKWYLERKAASEFGQTNKTKLVTDDGNGGDAPITLNLSKLSDSALDELEKQLPTD